MKNVCSNFSARGLEEEGDTVVCAADRVERLNLARSYDFDVIIL